MRTSSPSKYNSMMTVGEPRKYDDTDISTFQDVNRKIIMLNDTVYQALQDSNAKVTLTSKTVSFSNVTIRTSIARIQQRT